jgi:hypothetical protein
VLIRSMAGDFEISINGFEVEKGRLVMVGRMGVWDARTYITPREVLKVFGKLLRPGVLFFILRLPFLSFARKANEPFTHQEDES